jgi:fructose-1,6-bisphosphatase/inositol monophosphatase family enzyme
MLPDTSQISAIIKSTAEIEILPLFRKLKDHEVSDKESGEIVTAADVRAEERLTTELLKTVPGSVAVGEEAASEDNSILERLTEDKPVWVIDPLDGTRNFANGKECFAVIVAYCLNGQTLAGWIYDPVSQVMYTAKQGQGAWSFSREVEKQLKIAISPDINSMTGSVSKRHFERLKKRRPSPDIPGDMIRYRCVGREYTDLTLGVLHFAEYGMLKPWDHAAGILIHSEAGGYSAFTEDQTLYQPGPTTRKHLLAAANEDDWQTLRALFTDR